MDIKKTLLEYRKIESAAQEIVNRLHEGEVGLWTFMVKDVSQLNNFAVEIDYEGFDSRDSETIEYTLRIHPDVLEMAMHRVEKAQKEDSA